MKELASLKLTVPKLGMEDETIRIVEWTSEDPFPELGKSVGVDTETLLITDTCLAPDLVVLGVFDGEHRICYIVYWQHATAFMRELNRRDIEQRYFNLGFDELVLDKQDDEKTLMTAIDQNRVVDMSIRQNIIDIQTDGFIRYETASLAGASLHHLGIRLDKGDGTEDSARLSFKRYNSDGTPYVITEEQAIYLMFDCMTTWGLGEVLPVPPIDPKLGVSVEYAHTKGMVVLAHISANGFPVDMSVFEALEGKIKHDMDEARDVLIAPPFNFPDPYRDPDKERDEVNAQLDDQYARLMAYMNIEPGDWRHDKNALRLLVMYVYAHENEPTEFEQMVTNVRTVTTFDRKGLWKEEKTLWDELCEDQDHGIAAIDESAKKLPMKGFVGALLKSVCDQHDTNVDSSYSYAEAARAALEYCDSQPWWYGQEVAVGPKKKFQEEAQRLLSQNPGLQLEVTPKTGDIQLTLKDLWKLDDLGIPHKFFTAYTKFKHCEKLLSTYLNRDFIKEHVKADGSKEYRVHAHYTNLVVTGRTSCQRPNHQNLPSRDKEYPIKNMYTAPPGTILCATDFSFVELVNLAQSCLDRFGHSKMADIINAHVDPHRWFAGVRDGIINSDTEFTKDPEKVEEMNKLLEATVTKEARQHSKAANFNLEPCTGNRALHESSNCWKSLVDNQQPSLHSRKVQRLFPGMGSTPKRVEAAIT